MEYDTQTKLIARFEMGQEMFGSPPQYREKPFVVIMIAKDPTFKHYVLATERHKQQFPEAWRQFEESQKSSDIMEGNSLKSLPGMNLSLETNLKSVGIHTLQDLCKASRNKIKDIANAEIAKRHAKAYMAALKAISPEEIQDANKPKELPMDPAQVNQPPMPIDEIKKVAAGGTLKEL